MHFELIVVGGGASGLVAAIAAARNAQKVAILEQKDKIGKKILATGNGKCNYTNLVQDSEFYRGEHPDFAMKALHGFGVEDTISFFRELGIYPKERNGYLYPNSEQASSVLDVLRMELDHLGVQIFCNEVVNKIQFSSKGAVKSKAGQFVITTKERSFLADQVILATGGMASSELGSDGSGYPLAKSLGHKIIRTVPALVQLRSKEAYFKSLAGIRVQARIHLFLDGTHVHETKGELQLTNYGVSGIPIFELSRYAARAIDLGKKVKLGIDFMPDLTNKELQALIEERRSQCTYKNIEELLIGLFNKKLSHVLIREAGIADTLPSGRLRPEEIAKLVKKIKEFQVPIQEANSFANAQVTAGGVDTSELDPYTMESKLVPGLYITGELMDIDGTCGGYNLQWAWTSGYLAGMHASQRV